MERVWIRDFGVEIVFGGPLSPEQAEELLAELRRKLPPPGGRIGVLIDSRRSRAYSADEQASFRRGIELCAERGMERSVVVHDSDIAALQARRLAKQTGTTEGTRYVDARKHADWRRIAEDWLVKATDPDLT